MISVKELKHAIEVECECGKTFEIPKIVLDDIIKDNEAL